MKIKSIRKIGRRKTYDLVVPGLNNFFLSNGLLSHNSGKTTGMMSIAQSYHDNPLRNYKIWDLSGGERKEQYYWCLPSTHRNYWSYVKKKFQLDKHPVSQYRINLYFPMSRNLPKELPQLDNYVFPKIFTIPIKEITTEEIKTVLGDMAARDETLWNQITQKMKKNEGSAVLLKYFRQLKGTHTSLYRDFVAPLVNEGLLASMECEHNIDVRAESKDQESIMVLGNDFLPLTFRFFVVDYILSKQRRLLDDGKMNPKNIIMMREISNIFRVTERSIVPTRVKVVKEHLSNAIRYGRRGQHFLMDSQSPAETKGIVEGQQDLMVIGRMPGQTDRQAVAESLQRDNKITSKQVSDLADLKPGESYFVEVGKSAKKRYLFLPKTMYWTEGDGGFFSIWKRVKDSWISSKPMVQKILTQFDEENKKISDDEKFNAELKKQKEEEGKRREEEAKLKEYEEKLRKEREIKEKVKEDFKKKPKSQEKEIKKEETLEKPVEKQMESSEEEFLKEMFG